MKLINESEVTQSCQTLCDPMDCSLPGISIHGIFQARVLEWVAIAFSDTALTYSFSYLEPVCCFMSSSNCCFLTCIQVSHEAGQVVWYSHLFQNFPQFIVKAMVFPLLMYGCKSWTVKKAEHRRIDAFELWYWRRLLRVPWTARRSALGFLWKE